MAKTAFEIARDWYDEDDGEGCRAEWCFCERCAYAGSDHDHHGLVPLGEGLSIKDNPHNAWAHVELPEPFDICPNCTGSGGGYKCHLD